MNVSPVMHGPVVFSPCRTWRYVLPRAPLVARESYAKPPLVVCMLNPSTADETRDDPTVRRCRGFADQWGHAGLIVLNAYALRSTDPRGLWRVEDPVGPDNDHWIFRIAREAGDVVVAWGVHATEERVRNVSALIRAAGARMHCLGVTKAGAPRHPLYVASSTPLEPWPRA